jgi:hypothetical protein
MPIYSKKPLITTVTLGAGRVDSCEISLRPRELRFRTAMPAANRELAKPEIMSHILMRSGTMNP